MPVNLLTVQTFGFIVVEGTESIREYTIVLYSPILLLFLNFFAALEGSRHETIVTIVCPETPLKNSYVHLREITTEQKSGTTQLLKFQFPIDVVFITTNIISCFTQHRSSKSI